MLVLRIVLWSVFKKSFCLLNQKLEGEFKTVADRAAAGEQGSVSAISMGRQVSASHLETSRNNKDDLWEESNLNTLHSGIFCPLLFFTHVFHTSFFFRNSLFAILVEVCWRTAYDHSVVVPTHSVAWAVGAADQSSVEGWALQSSVGNCWISTEGTCTPLDQSATSGWVAMNSGAGAVHSPWNSSLVTAFSAAACSSFSISSGSL